MTAIGNVFHSVKCVVVYKAYCDIQNVYLKQIEYITTNNDSLNRCLQKFYRNSKCQTMLLQGMLTIYADY